MSSNCLRSTLRTSLFAALCIGAPARLPQPVLRRLAADTIKGITSADGRAKLFEAGFDVVGNTPEEFTLMLRGQIELVGKILKSTGMKLADQ